jgi:hypothetical protein
MRAFCGGRETLIASGELGWRFCKTFQRRGGFVHEWTKVKEVMTFTKFARECNLPFTFRISNYRGIIAVRDSGR